MSRRDFVLIIAALVSSIALGETVTNDIGIITNWPAVYSAKVRVDYSYDTNYVRTNLPDGKVLRYLTVTTNASYWTNRLFKSFVPGSLSYEVWTNFMVLSSNRTLRIWETRQHPIGWPVRKPVVKWDKSCLLFGMQGFTGLSPCWEGEGNSGQVPITALTRRHGYTRGHAMGPSGENSRLKGQKVWFLSKENQLVEVRILRSVTRTMQPDNRDYTIMLFDRDLPQSITPLAVTSEATIRNVYPTLQGCPNLLFKTEQGGYVSAEVEGFKVNTWKGGDSGSPNMLPLPNRLVFFSGRSTSGPSREMQHDLDILSRSESLDPKKYQLNWANLEAELPAAPGS